MGSPPPRANNFHAFVRFHRPFFKNNFFFLIIILFSSIFLFFHILTTLRFIFDFFMDIMILFFFSTSYTSNVHIHKAELPFKKKPVCDKAVTDAKYRSGPHSRTGPAAPVYSQ